ncbi:MAG: macro domain-containing protein [Saprospiraceae bacterium]|nr:macro domain-containing protein [Saprospiraceae bacterium]
MKVTEGDLIQLALAGEFDVIIHGCNCFCTMGAGIALSIKRTFPEAYQADLATESGDRSKLGTISWATQIREGKELIIVNGYTQYNWRGKGVKVEYDAVDSVFKLVKEKFGGKRIGYPAIGAGLAGGDWQKIEAIIREALAGEDHTFVKYKPK